MSDDTDALSTTASLTDQLRNRERGTFCFRLEDCHNWRIRFRTLFDLKSELNDLYAIEN